MASKKRMKKETTTATKNPGESLIRLANHQLASYCFRSVLSALIRGGHAFLFTVYDSRFCGVAGVDPGARAAGHIQ